MNNFKEWLYSEGIKRRVRSRFSDMEKFLGIHPELSYSSKKEAKADTWNAYRRAQEINREHGNRVEVYHMINRNRMSHNLEDTLRYLMGKSGEEISVSVNKGVWSSGLVLRGEGRLLLYYPTDVNTQINARGLKVPVAAKRAVGSHHWDEGILRLSDVEWDTIFVGDDDNNFDWNTVKNLANKFDLSLKHSGESGFGSALNSTVDLEEDIEKLEGECYALAGEITNRVMELGTDKFKEIWKEFGGDYILEKPIAISAEDWLNELEEEKSRLEKILRRLV
jgi:hypothetical protein